MSLSTERSVFGGVAGAEKQAEFCPRRRGSERRKAAVARGRLSPFYFYLVMSHTRPAFRFQRPLTYWSRRVAALTNPAALVSIT